ncbi:hypothetical protein AHAS_Ahas18G0227100 [Arachis hypogaea]
MAEEIRFFELNTGAKIPSVGLGTFQAENPGALAKAATTAIKVGYGHIDCASSYGNQVMDLDRRVRRGQERLAQEVEPEPALPL